MEQSFIIKFNHKDAIDSDELRKIIDDILLRLDDKISIVSVTPHLDTTELEKLQYIIQKTGPISEIEIDVNKVINEFLDYRSFMIFCYFKLIDADVELRKLNSKDYIKYFVVGNSMKYLFMKLQLLGLFERNSIKTDSIVGVYEDDTLVFFDPTLPSDTAYGIGAFGTEPNIVKIKYK